MNIQDGKSPFHSMYGGSPEESFHADAGYGTSVAFNQPFETTKIRIKKMNRKGNDAARIRELIVYGVPASAK